MRISLKANEKIFINGAIIRTDRKVTLELVNDATFLLQTHVILESETDTPLKQLYYAGQMVLINPQNNEKNMPIFMDMLNRTIAAFEDQEILENLRDCVFLAKEGRFFEILKIIRGLYGRETTAMSASA